MEAARVADALNPGGAGGTTPNGQNGGAKAEPSATGSVAGDPRAADLLAALQQSSDHLYAYDRSGRYLYVSPAGAAALGLTPADMVGRHWRDLGLPPEVMERFDSLCELVLDSGQPVKARTLYPGSDRLRDYELWLFPINGGGTRPETLLCVAREVEGRPAQEDGVVDLSPCWPGEPLPMLVCYVDAAQRYRYNSGAYSDWFGRSPGEIHGSCLCDVLGDAAYERVRPFVETALAGTPVHFEQVVPYKEAGTRTVRAHYLPDIGYKGEVRGFFALINDLTPDSEGRGDALGTTGPDMLGVRERLATIGEMATEILHEMSQPPTSIGLFSETGERMMTSTPGEGAQALEVLEEIRRQAERARSMMEKLRRFVRSGRASEAPVEINHLVRAVMRVTAPEIDARGVALDVKLRTGLCIISAERILLEQVLLHLIRNALGAMADVPRAERRLVVRTGRTRQRVSISVADTGVGLTGERRQRILGPFRGGHGASGLGLAISRAIIGSLGGSLRMKSLPGRGAVVRFTLPVTCEE